MPWANRVIGVSLLGAVVAIAVTVGTSTFAQQTRSPSTEQVSGGVGAPEPATDARSRREIARSRIELATAIVGRLQAEAKVRGLGDRWHKATLERLLLLTPDALDSVQQTATSLDALESALDDVSEDPSLFGSPSADLVYTPITPCRFIDTRNHTGKISGFASFSLHVSGASYGGSAACEPAALFGAGPDAIAALAMNVTIVDTLTAGAPGFVAIKPTADAPTTSLVNWYEAGASIQTANHAIVTTHQDTSDNVEFVIQTSGPVQVIVDIFGAFVAPQATPVDTIHVFDVTIIPPFTYSGNESPPCPAGYTLTGGGCYTPDSKHELWVSSIAAGGNRWVCQSVNHNLNASSALWARALCSRTPGR